MSLVVHIALTHLKNEYPELGGDFEVIHHTQLINQLIREGKLLLKEGVHLMERKSHFMIHVIWEEPMVYMKYQEMY